MFQFRGLRLKIALRQKLRILPHSAGSVAKIIFKRRESQAINRFKTEAAQPQGAPPLFSQLSLRGLWK
jgi:hypothetical protein